MRWAEQAGSTGKRTDPQRLLVGKPARKRPLGKPRRRWEDNIKTSLKEIGREGVEKGQLAGSCEHGNEPSGSIK
jgi:hypothetical protein